MTANYRSFQKTWKINYDQNEFTCCRMFRYLV